MVTSAEFVIVSLEIRTSRKQRVSVPPAGQVVPGVVEVTVLSSLWSPVPGVSTVTL